MEMNNTKWLYYIMEYHKFTISHNIRSIHNIIVLANLTDNIIEEHNIMHFHNVVILWFIIRLLKSIIPPTVLGTKH